MSNLMTVVCVLNLVVMAGVLILLAMGLWRCLPLLGALMATLEKTQAALEQTTSSLRVLERQVVPVLSQTHQALGDVRTTLDENVKPVLVRAETGVEEVIQLLRSLNGKVEPAMRLLAGVKGGPRAATTWVVKSGHGIAKKLQQRRQARPGNTLTAVVPLNEDQVEVSSKRRLRDRLPWRKD